MKGAGGASSWGAVSRGQQSLDVWEDVGRGYSEQLYFFAAGGVGSGSGPSLWKRANPSWQVNSMLKKGTDEGLESVEMCA